MFTKFKENLKKAFLFLVLFLIGISIFVSLLSFNQSDNNFLSYDSNNLDYDNLFGVSGSFLSYFLLEIFSFNNITDIRKINIGASVVIIELFIGVEL